jgi:hypothetical protein
LTLAIILVLLLVMGNVAQAETAQENKDEDVPQGWALLPRVGVSVGYGGYIVQQDNYTSLVRRSLEVDFLQYQRHIFYLNFNEYIYLGTPSNPWEFNLMKYDTVLGGYRYDFGDYYLGLFLHHQCNNPILTQNYNNTHNYNILVDRERANIFDMGLEFLTKTMRLGMKDRGINFDSPEDYEFLGRFAGEFSASKVLYCQNIILDYLVTGDLRYDILRYYRLIPYVEVTGNLTAGPTTRLAPGVEVGTRLHLGSVDFTPFFQWSRNQEALTTEPSDIKSAYIAKNALMGGARMEVLLDAKNFPGSPTIGDLQWFPEIHGMANYALMLHNPFFSGYGDNELDIEALRWGAWTLFLYTDMNFNSRKIDWKPDTVNYWLQYGVTYNWQNYFVEGFVNDANQVDSNEFRDMERSNLAGLRLGTEGMKPGHYNDGISFSDSQTFQWLNKWNAQGVVGHYFSNRDWQYLWNINAQVRWDPLRWRIVVPYIQAEVNWMSGGGSTPDAFEYAGESGIRFHGVLDFEVYYRFQHCENVLFYRGPTDNESLVGVKVMF